ncbi:hypothetical protein B0H21DRAFT_811581, partial [Amylocystis lapponica]
THPLEKHIARNHKSWCDFANNVSGGNLAQQDIIFVRGWAKTSGWTVAECSAQARKTRISIGGDLGAFVQGSSTVEKSVKGGSWQYRSGAHRTRYDGREVSGGSRSSDVLPTHAQCFFVTTSCDHAWVFQF